MPHATLRTPLRRIALLAGLFLSFQAAAQQTYYEAGIECTGRAGERIWLHEGKPLQGLCKITFMDIDFVPRYTLSRFYDGVRSDTIHYHRARTDKLERTEIRLGGEAVRILDYDLYNGSRLREWTQVDGRKDGVLREWYGEGRLRLEENYKAGELDGLRREWDESGRLTVEERYCKGELDGLRREWDESERLTAEARYCDGVPDGKTKRWHYEGDGWGEIEVASHDKRSQPYMIERYAFIDDQYGLIERTIPGGDGETLYSARKQDCDSTRIDTLSGGRMMVEIRDFREGQIRSLERYDASIRYGTLVPHGVFELYAPDGRVGTRMRYEEGELILARDYDYDLEPRTDVRTSLLSRAQGEELLAASYDSKHLTGCDQSKPLRIVDRAGEEILTLEEEDRRYEYYGYDPDLKFHLAFSSVGDWNDVHWYVVYDHGGVSSMLETKETYLTVNGTTGLIAATESPFEGEQNLAVYRFFTDEDAGGYFEWVFSFTLPDVPSPVWGIHWVGEHALLLMMEESCIRVDIDPESFEGYSEELACTNF